MKRLDRGIPSYMGQGLTWVLRGSSGQTILLMVILPNLATVGPTFLAW